MTCELPFLFKRLSGPAGCRGSAREDRVFFRGRLESDNSADLIVETPRGASPRRRGRSNLPRRARGASELTKRRTPPQRRPTGRLYNGKALSRHPLRLSVPALRHTPRELRRRRSELPADFPDCVARFPSCIAQLAEC